jgi:hypothetical protein
MAPVHDESSYVEQLAELESVLHEQEPDVPPEPGAGQTRPSIRVHRWIASG